MSKRQFSYSLQGIPVAFSRQYNERGFWNTYRQNRLNYTMQLEEQHKSAPLSGPLELSLIFHFSIPDQVRSKKYGLPGQVHVGNPSLISLYEFIASIGTGILFKNSDSIVTLSCHKKYDSHPHIDVVIKELV